jgi:DNA-binding MarR family transcriptional regulator
MMEAFEQERLRIQANRPIGMAYMVSHLERALRRKLRQALEPLGLTIAQYTALSVFHNSGRLSNAQLAERIMVSPQAANALIKTIEKKDWIVRTPDPNHGRIINISLTTKGKKLLARCDKVIAKTERAMLKGFSNNQIVSLHGQLRDMVGVLREI